MVYFAELTLVLPVRLSKPVPVLRKFVGFSWFLLLHGLFGDLFSTKDSQAILPEFILIIVPETSEVPLFSERANHPRWSTSEYQLAVGVPTKEHHADKIGEEWILSIGNYVPQKIERCPYAYTLLDAQKTAHQETQSLA